MLKQPQEELVKKLETKLDQLGPPLDQAKLQWPFSLTFEKLTEETWEIARSRHLTSLSTTNALKSEVTLLSEVVKDLT
jgi:hypothetical protein